MHQATVCFNGASGHEVLPRCGGEWAPSQGDLPDTSTLGTRRLVHVTDLPLPPYRPSVPA